MKAGWMFTNALRNLDLASMQHHQQAARQSASGLRDPQVYQSQRPPMRSV